MGKLKILVVEDEFIFALELKSVLEAMGFAVCGVVSSGEKAVEYATRENPDCVLMDVSLKGGIDGIEAARRIGSSLGIRTVLMSGYPAEEVMPRAGEVDLIGFLVKPLEYAKLEALLGQFFNAATGGGD